MVLPLRRLAAGVLLASAAAAGQSAPDESWNAFPVEQQGPPSDLPGLRRPAPPPLIAAPPYQPRAAPRLPPQPRVEQPAAPPKPEELNDVSLYGAPPLGVWQRGLGVYLGFPLLGVRAGLGVHDGIDLGVAFDSYYGMMNEFRAHGRYQLLRGARWTAAAVIEGGAALFTQRASAEDHGPRWITGRRNYNLLPGLVLSYRGGAVRSARLFFDLRYHLAFDTEPYYRDPLGGVPPAFQIGHNVPFRFGAELPFSSKTSFVFTLGFDVHGRAGDSPFMPVCSVGLVSAI